MKEFFIKFIHLQRERIDKYTIIIPIKKLFSRFMHFFFNKAENGFSLMMVLLFEIDFHFLPHVIKLRILILLFKIFYVRGFFSALICLK